MSRWGDLYDEIRRILIKPKWRISFTQILCLLISLAILATPIVMDFMEQHKSDEVITTYTKQMTQNAEDYPRLLAEAQAYNARLANEPYDESIAIPPVDELIMGDNRAFAWVEIPQFDERIPVYHGTTHEVLQMGVGHLEGTSIPVGGPSTHAALSGHSGLANTRMFDDIDQLEVGDIFLVHILDQTLAYKVIGWDIVLPDDSSSLAIQKGRDLCSLITCYPYGVNTHRYIVHGERTDYFDMEEEPVPGSFLNQRTYPFIIAMIVLLILFLLWWRAHPKEIGHNAKGIKRMYRHDYQPVLPILPEAEFVYIYPKYDFLYIKQENIEKAMRRAKEKEGWVELPGDEVAYKADNKKRPPEQEEQGICPPFHNAIKS